MSDESGAGEATGADYGEPAEGEEIQEQETQEEEPRGKPKKPAPKMRKVKINGADEYVDEDEVFRNYQKYRAGEARLREASQKEESVRQFYARLKEDPDSVLRDPELSISRRDLAEKWLMEEWENDTKQTDPRDQKLSEMEKRLKAYEDRDREAQEKELMSEKEKFLESRKMALSTTLAEAMQATHLSADKESAASTMREMAVYMRAAKERGEDVTPDELVEHVHNARFRQMYSLAHQYDGDELLEFFGDEIANRISKAHLAKLRSGREKPAQTYRNDSYQTSEKQQIFIDPADERFAFRSGR